MDFVDYFQDMNSDHMWVEVIKYEVYEFFAPNQCDFQYVIQRIGDDLWNVKGVKHDPLSYFPPSLINCDYQLVDDEWIVAFMTS